MQNVIDPSTPPESDLIPINRIRVETAISRFPIHRLARKDTVTIDLQHLTEDGSADFKWEVNYNQKHGQPGPLAYKVDTLIVNRCIDEAGRPLPDVIKLGSLTEICAALGISDSGENRANIRKALHQNASAYITAKFRYRTKTGKEKWREIGYSRYSVVFTGERLPDESVASAVYIVPNAAHRELLNQAEVRPLDYDYLMLLAPGPQRFYELISFQVYGALAGGRPRAKMLYSEYCDYAPQVRYPNFERVKKQMFKIHAPHREAGYIAKVEYHEFADGEGNLDWEMLYTPGPKAIAEFEAFTRRQIRRDSGPLLIGGSSGPAIDNASGDPVDVALLAALIRRGIAENSARDLLANLKPGQEVMDQLEYVDALVAKDTRHKLDNPPGLYVHYIRDNLIPPLDFPTSRKLNLNQQIQREKAGGQARVAQLKLEYEAECGSEVDRYIAEMPSEEYQALFEKHRRENRSLLRHMADVDLDRLTENTVRAEVRQGNRVKFATFQEFVQRQKMTP